MTELVIFVQNLSRCCDRLHFWLAEQRSRLVMHICAAFMTLPDKAPGDSAGYNG